MSAEKKDESGEKKVVGLVEKVKIIGRKEVFADAIIDTGATGTSIDVRIAKEAELGPITGTVKVKSKTSADGYTRRIKVDAKIDIKGKIVAIEANIQDRKNMHTPVLIGRDVLYSNFVVDVEKTHNSNKIDDTKE